MPGPLRARATARRFRPFRQPGRWQAAQPPSQPMRGDSPHRFILVRRPTPQRAALATQLTVWGFQDVFSPAFVSNLPLQPAAIDRFYAGRANVELDIRALKAALPLGQIPTPRFTANAVHCERILLAYDLVHGFRALGLGGSGPQARLRTIRREVVMRPARLLQVGHRHVLRLPDTYPHRKRFQHAASTIAKLRIDGWRTPLSNGDRALPTTRLRHLAASRRFQVHLTPSAGLRVARPVLLASSHGLL